MDGGRGGTAGPAVLHPTAMKTHTAMAALLPDAEYLDSIIGGAGGGGHGTNGGTTLYRCRICCTDCGSHKGWLQHVVGKKHRHRRDGGGPPPWRMEELELFPCRATTLCPHAFVGGLPLDLRLRLTAYLRARCPHSPELVDVVDQISVTEQKHLRVKELVETVEASLVIGDEIHARNSADKESDGCGPVKSIYDMACGHGLLGCLLAYRFAQLRVVCVDTTRRPCFDTYIDAFKRCGVADEGETEVLSNLEFIEGDLGAVEVGAGAFLAGVHACNGATGAILKMAACAAAGFAVLPCCIPDMLYAVQTTRNLSGTKASMGDDVRYAVQVGVIAQTYKARRVCCIDRRITNRNLVVLGGGPPDHPPPVSSQ
jgi:hypothetical protein